MIKKTLPIWAILLAGVFFQDFVSYSPVQVDKELSDNDMTVIYNYALALKGVGQYEKSRELLEQSLNTHPLAKDFFKLLRDIDQINNTKTCSKLEVDTPYKPSVKEIHAKEVMLRLQSWETAWTKQLFNKYITHYDSGFMGVMTKRENWLRDRKLRITSPKNIQVEIKNIHLEFIAENLIQTTFKQDYQATNFHSVKEKVILWQKQDDTWNIVFEGVTGN